MTRPDVFTAAAARYAQVPPHPLERYRGDPAGFARDCIDWPEGEGLTPYQQEILTELVTAGRVAARGPHGLGKTTLSALAVLWLACTRDALGTDWKVITTAGSWRQLTLYLWPEIGKWARRLRWDVLGRGPFSERTELLALNLQLRHGAASAAASDNAALMEGAHADAILYVFDEAKSIPAATFDAAEGALSGATGGREAFALALSTPGEPAGRFYDIHARKPGLTDWSVRHVTLAEAVAAGRISSAWAAQRALQWGEASALYANRVLGEFHADDEAGVIPLAWVESAVERWREWDAAGRPEQQGPRVVGVDVARSGVDKTVLAVRQGDVLEALHYYSHADTMATVGRVRALGAARWLAVVDVIGVGAGVVDRLREQGAPVQAFHASEGSKNRDKSGELGFLNVRSAGWWRVRELLDPASDSTLALPPDDLLVGDLTAPHWRVNSRGQIQVEGKDEIRRRLGRSTDSGDAVVMALWVPSAAGAPDDNLAVPYGTLPLDPSEAAVPYASPVWPDQDGFTWAARPPGSVFADEWHDYSASSYGWRYP